MELTTLERLTKILLQQLDVSEPQIKPESDLVEDLGADSLDCVEVIMEIEEEFDIDIEDAEADKIKTVADLVALIDLKLA